MMRKIMTSTPESVSPIPDSFAASLVPSPKKTGLTLYTLNLNKYKQKMHRVSDIAMTGYSSYRIHVYIIYI